MLSQGIKVENERTYIKPFLQQAHLLLEIFDNVPTCLPWRRQGDAAIGYEVNHFLEGWLFECLQWLERCHQFSTAFRGVR